MTSTFVLFGSPHLQRDGTTIEVDTRKAIALLAYLVVTGRRHTRDAIAALLWPEYDQRHARSALRRTLSSLNKALPDCLDIDRAGVGFKPESDLFVDLHQLQRNLAACATHGHAAAEVCPQCVRLLAEVVALYGDDFMAGFGLRDSATFDDWQLWQAEHWRRELAAVLDRLIRWHTGSGEYAAALRYGHRRLALDPLHEATYRTLMQVYAWSGQRTAALQLYRDCVAVLERELGVEPLAATTDLCRAISSDSLPPPALKQAPSPDHNAATIQPRETAVILSARPFVGRAAELATLYTVYDEIGADGRLVVVEGTAGIGKTRLVEEWLAHIRSNGAAVIVLRSYPDEAKLAFGAFIDGVRDALRKPARLDAVTRVADHWLVEAARLVPELATIRPQLAPPPALDSPGAQSRFFEGLSNVLLALAAGPAPGVLFCDDLHWADTASLDLLAYLVRRLRGRPLCLIATWRTEDVPAQHRLRQIVGGAKRAQVASVLELRELGQTAVHELVDAVLPPALQVGDLSARLYRETDGVPLFVMEYLAAIADGSLSDADGAWVLPGGVRDVLRARLHAIGETARQTLTTAAVIGRSFDFEMLRAVSGRSEDETIVALEELIGQGLVGEVSGGTDALLRYDFAHDRLRQFVYAETSLTRRRVLHRRVADVLLDRGRVAGGMASSGSRPYSLIANHLRLAGHDRDAAHYFQQAGEAARRVFANAEALDHLRTALHLGHPQPAALHEAIGDLLTLQGEYAAALSSYDAAVAPDAPEVDALLEHKRGVVHQRRGVWALAEQAYAAALAALGEQGPAAVRSRILADRSFAARSAGRPMEALGYAQAALKLAEQAGDARALAQAHNMLGMLLSREGHAADAEQHFQQSAALAQTLGDPGVRIAALNNLALSYRSTGALEEAISLAEQALALCHEWGDRHREAALHNNLADLYHALGNRSHAMQHLKRSVTIYADIGVEAGTIQPAIWKLTEW